MFKLQIILIPPRALDLQVPNHPVINSPINLNERIRFPMYNSKRHNLIFTNNVTSPYFTVNTNASALNCNSTSIMNCSISTPSTYNLAIAANQKTLKQWKLKLNQIIAYRNQLFQKHCKKFLLFINLQSDLNQLANEISLKFKDMYPNFTEELNIVTIQDNNGNDLDPDYIVKDIFNTNNIVKVFIDKDVDWNNPKYLETKYTRHNKRRKMNPKKYSSNRINRNHNNDNRNVPNIRIYASRAPEVYRDIDSVIMDDMVDQSILKPSSKFQSWNSISTPNVSQLKTKNIGDKSIEKVEEQNELYDQSSPKETLLGTPVMSIITPNKLTDSQQKLYSNDNYLTVTVRHPNTFEIVTESASNNTSPMKTPITKNNFSSTSVNGVSTTIHDPSKAIMSPSNPPMTINTLSNNNNSKLVEINEATIDKQKTRNNLMNKELNFERPSALSMAKRASLQRQQSTIANDRGSPMKNGQLSKKLSENVHLAELPTKSNNISELKNKFLENNNKSKSILEKIMEHQKNSSTLSSSNKNIPNIVTTKYQENNIQEQKSRQIVNNNNHYSYKLVENHSPKSNDGKQKLDNISFNNDKNQSDHQQKNEKIGSLDAKGHTFEKNNNKVKDKSYSIGKLDTSSEDSKAKHTHIIKNDSLITVIDKKVESHSKDNIDTNSSSKSAPQKQTYKHVEKLSNDLNHLNYDLLSKKNSNIPDNISPTLLSVTKSKETSQKPQVPKLKQFMDRESKKKNVNKSQKEFPQLVNHDIELKNNQLNKTSTHTSEVPVNSNNLTPINTKVTSEISQPSSNVVQNTLHEALSKLVHNQEETRISYKNFAKISDSPAVARNKPFNKKSDYDNSPRNPSFQKVELLQMFENDNLKTPPWFSSHQNFTIERVIGKSKKKPYLTVLNKDIDNSKPDPRNILPSRTQRNAARKASLRLSGQAADLKDYESDNNFNGTEEFESYSESEGEDETTSSSGIMTDISSDEEVLANLTKPTKNFTVSGQDLKESIVSDSITNTDDKTSTNPNQTQIQSYKNHDISGLSTHKINDRNSRYDKLVSGFSRNEITLDRIKNFSSYGQNKSFEKSVRKNNTSVNNINNNLYQSSIHPKILQYTVNRAPETIILSDESDDSDELDGPERFSKNIPNKRILKINNQDTTKSASNKKDDDIEASTFMDYLKHPEVGEDLLLDLESSESNGDEDDDDDISNIPSSSSDISIKEIRQVQFPIKTSNEMLTMDKTVYSLFTLQNTSRCTSILHSINSNSTSTDNRSSLEFVTNTSTNISSRLQRLNNTNLKDIKKTGSIEVSSLAYGSPNTATEERLAETSSEYETSSVEFYEE